MIHKVLIANRGEIAIRVCHTLREMGIGSAAVYTAPDARSLHVRTADESYPISSYLDAQEIVAAAKAAGADAIHPGYGFLSESPKLSAACEESGVIFIGPRPDTLRAMGDKLESKRMMREAGVPTVPSWDREPPAAAYPVLVKAVGGGGGKGMRLVERQEDLAAALASASREAASAFGNDRVFVEKYIRDPRHIEFQIFGDSHGNQVHIFERECSIQRRHQKIIEESPSVVVTPEIRQQMGAAAVAAARAVNYRGAGTVEFILESTGSTGESTGSTGESTGSAGDSTGSPDGDHGSNPTGRFYFLEMNTRLQVEHPVTEMITGLDLVREQVLVASGAALSFRQQDVHQLGHALECRIYAEVPEENFRPSTGVIEVLRPPTGPGIRLDSGIEQGSDITFHFDPMLAKLIVWAPDRSVAIGRMIRALDDFVLLGVQHNIDFLRRIIASDDFASGNLSTHFLERRRELFQPAADMTAEILLAASLNAMTHAEGASGTRAREEANTTNFDVWTSGPWRNS